MITNLRRALAESDLNQSSVAARVGISDTLLSEFVCGRRPIRPVYHLLNLANALNRRPSELLGVTYLEGETMSTTEPEEIPAHPNEDDDNNPEEEEVEQDPADPGPNEISDDPGPTHGP